MKRLSWIAVLVLGLGMEPGALAKPHIGLTETAARGYSSTEADGSFHLDEKAQWDADVTFTHTNSTTSGNLSTANEFMFGATDFLDDANDWRGAIDYWNDTTNKIRYVGPTASYTHTWFETQGRVQDQDTVETWGLTLDLGLNFYSADVDVTSNGKEVRKGTPNVVTKAASVTTTQFHPSLTLEHAFYDEALVPFITAGHYFYSVDPNTLESAVNKVGVRLSPASTAGVDVLVGGFIKNSWALGTVVVVAPKTKLKLEYGRNQSATDDTWSTAYSVKVEHTFGERWRGSLGWSHAVQQDVPIEFGTLGLAYLF
ncbi:MAG: hypothetical protein HY074_07490 [Deltaproteobacteria bacterium]|nr:hypothetical protein [Deltaproteobacteria bacterium]